MHSPAFFVVLVALVQVYVDGIHGRPASGFQITSQNNIVASSDAMLDAQLQQILGIWQKTLPDVTDWKITISSKENLGGNVLGTTWGVVYVVSGTSASALPADLSQNINDALNNARLPGISTFTGTQPAADQTADAGGNPSTPGFAVDSQMNIVASTDDMMDAQLQAILGVWKTTLPDVTDWNIVAKTKMPVGDSPLGRTYAVTYTVSGKNPTPLPDDFSQKLNDAFNAAQLPGISSFTGDSTGGAAPSA